MGAVRVKCICPQCKANYQIPASALGHRAKCTTCGAVFRLNEYYAQPPSEEDILQWLREAEDREDAMMDAEEAAMTDYANDRASPDDSDAPLTTQTADASELYGRVISIQDRVNSRMDSSPIPSPRVKSA